MCQKQHPTSFAAVTFLQLRVESTEGHRGIQECKPTLIVGKIRVCTMLEQELHVAKPSIKRSDH